MGLFDLVPAPYRWMLEAGIVALAMAVLVGAGYHWGETEEHLRRVAEVAGQKAEYDARITTAEEAKEAAEHRADMAMTAGRDALALADTNHQTEIRDEQAKTAAAVAAYRAGDQRLRFYLDAAAHASGGGAVPGAASPASGGDGRAIGELPAALAGSLSALVGEVDDTLIPQLHLAQETIKAYLTVCGPVAGAPVEGGPPAEGATAQPSSALPKAVSP